jgi:type I restriction enzyme S subunit
MCAISGKTDAELDAFLEASTPEQRQQLTVTAALFPDELEDSDLGAIPKGWSSGITGDLFELHRGYDLPKKKRIAGKYFVYAAGGTHGTHNEYKIEPPGIITGRSGVIGNAFLSLEKFWPLNTTLYIREFRACGPYYAFHFLKSCDFSVFNSGSAVPSLNRNFVHSLKTIIPDPELLMTFEKLVAPIFEMVKHQNDESRTMSSLRNEMLPKLLSGEIILSGTLSAAASVAC